MPASAAGFSASPGFSSVSEPPSFASPPSGADSGAGGDSVYLIEGLLGTRSREMPDHLWRELADALMRQPVPRAELP